LTPGRDAGDEDDDDPAAVAAAALCNCTAL